MHFWHNRVWPPCGRSLYSYSVYTYIRVHAKRERERERKKRERESESERDRPMRLTMSKCIPHLMAMQCLLCICCERDIDTILRWQSRWNGNRPRFISWEFSFRETNITRAILFDLFCDYFSAAQIVLVTLHFFRPVRKLCLVIHISLLVIEGGALANCVDCSVRWLHLNWDSKNWKSQFDCRGGKQKAGYINVYVSNMRYTCNTNDRINIVTSV